jgi:glycerate kinase
MRVLIAPDKFKGCLSAADVAAAMAEGVRDADPNMEIDLCPVADGGDGTADVLLAARGGRRVACRVTGPLPERHVDAWFVQLDDGSALVELAAASGLALLAPGDRDPLRTTTFGTGELVAAAVRAGARRVLLALGGSGTVDGGIGCVQACGFTILTTDGEPTSPTDPLCGRDLDRVLMVKHGRGEITNGIEVVAACDVTNPLCGPTGAARVFGPQKGASPAAVDWLDDQLSRLSRHHPDEAALPGAGAAGGMGFAVAAYFGGSLRSGFDLVADAVGLPERLRSADLCLTGEGCLDATTRAGKSVAGVGRLAAAAGVPCVALAGAVPAGTDLPTGILAATAIADRGTPVEESHRDARKLLRMRAAEVVRQWAAQARRRRAGA